MKLTKPIPDSVQNTLAKASIAILRPLETTLQSSGEGTRAQKLRKLQHQLIGLSEDQWQYITDYFECEKILLVVSQAQEMTVRYHNEERLWLDQAPPGNDTDRMERYNKRRAYFERKFQLYRTQIHAVEGVMGLLRIKMGRTPLYRAMMFHRRDPGWYLGEWLRDKCADNGGCCGRSCNCCEKPRGITGSPRRFGHCTPVCDCCDRHYGNHNKLMFYNSAYPGKVNLISRKVKRYLHIEMEYVGHAKLDPRKEKKDLDSALLMNAYVWGLDLREEGSDC